MIRHDGKNLDVHIEGLSQDLLEKILDQHGNSILSKLGEKIDGISKATNYQGGQYSQKENEEEAIIVSNSLEKIADIMSTTNRGEESNINKKSQNITTTTKDVSKTIDLLKNLD